MSENKLLVGSDSPSLVIMNAYMSRDWGHEHCPYKRGTPQARLWNECRFGKASDAPRHRPPKRTATARNAARLFMERYK